jgi:hypothetical protein
MTLQKMIEECTRGMDPETIAEYFVNVLTDSANKNRTPMQMFEREYKAMTELMDQLGVEEIDLPDSCK